MEKNYVAKKLLSLFLSLAVIISGITVTNRVNVKAETVKDSISITYVTHDGKPISIDQGTNGYWCLNNENNFYFQYNVKEVFNSRNFEGDSIILNYENGVTKKLTARLILDIMNNIKRIAFINPDSEAANYNYFIESKYFNEQTYHFYKQNPEEVYCYSSEDYNNGDLIFKDSLEINTQSYNHKMISGKTYNVKIHLLGKETTLPVTINSNGIKKIRFKPAKGFTIKAGTNGEWSYYNTNLVANDGLYYVNSKESYSYPWLSTYYYYDTFSFYYRTGNQIILTRDDNSKIVYTCKNGIYKDKDGKELPECTFFDTQCFNSEDTFGIRYRPGKSYKSYLGLEGLGCSFDIKIKKDNSIKSIKYIQSKPIKITKKKWYIHAEDYLFKKGNKLIIKYKNGKKKVYTCKKTSKKPVNFVDKSGEILSYKDIRFHIDYPDNGWEAGKKYKVTITCFGFKTRIPVTVTK